MTNQAPSIADLAVEGLRRGDPDCAIAYKFQGITAYSLDALKNGYLYFSTYKQLNDPFDPFVELYASRFGQLAEQISGKGIRVFCVTNNPTDPRMWAHYANAFSGMRIGYAISSASPAIFSPIRYLDKIAGGFNQLDFLFIKTRHWDYEDEYRAVISGGEPKQFGFAHPVSVCLGAHCSNENMERVRAVLPGTVTDFDIALPIVENSVPQYKLFDVDSIVRAYGGLPDLKTLYR